MCFTVLNCAYTHSFVQACRDISGIFSCALLELFILLRVKARLAYMVAKCFATDSPYSPSPLSMSDFCFGFCFGRRANADLLRKSESWVGWSQREDYPWVSLDQRLKCHCYTLLSWVATRIWENDLKITIHSKIITISEVLKCVLCFVFHCVFLFQQLILFFVHVYKFNFKIIFQCMCV